MALRGEEGEVDGFFAVLLKVTERWITRSNYCLISSQESVSIEIHDAGKFK